jgi:hypothetical protein
LCSSGKPWTNSAFLSFSAWSEGHGRVEIYGAKDVALRISAQLFERGSVEHCAAVPVVDVFLDDDLARARNLLLQLSELALDGLLLLLPIRAHSRIERCPLHMS